MIAHLVGGPAHGEDFSVTDPPKPIILVPKLDETLPILPYYNLDFERVPGPMEEHQYRLLHHDGRIATYRWQAPRVAAQFEFTVRSGRDRDILDRKINELIRGEKLQGQTVTLVSANYDVNNYHVAGIALVDGPADAKAAEDAAAAVKAVIDRHLRFFEVTQFAVNVDG